MNRYILNALLGLVIVLCFWQVISTILAAPLFLPSPYNVGITLYHAKPTLIMRAGTTITEAAVGIAIASLLSIFLIIVIGCFKNIENLLYPFLVVLKSTPVVAFIPIIIFIFGTGISSKITVSVIISFFPLVVGGVDGIKLTPARYRVFSSSYGADRYQYLRRTLFPYAASGFLTGMKTAAPLSVVGAIVGEYLAGGTPRGIGTYLMSENAQFHLAEVYCGAIVASLIGIFFFGAAHASAILFSRRYHLDQ